MGKVESSRAGVDQNPAPRLVRERDPQLAALGTATRRRVEPYQLVATGRRWYLLAWDLDRDDWRTFRVDRITPRTPTGPRFTPRELPVRASRGKAAAARAAPPACQPARL